MFATFFSFLVFISLIHGTFSAVIEGRTAIKEVGILNKTTAADEGAFLEPDAAIEDDILEGRSATGRIIIANGCRFPVYVAHARGPPYIQRASASVRVNGSPTGRNRATWAERWYGVPGQQSAILITYRPNGLTPFEFEYNRDTNGELVHFDTSTVRGTWMHDHGFSVYAVLAGRYPGCFNSHCNPGQYCPQNFAAGRNGATAQCPTPGDVYLNLCTISRGLAAREAADLSADGLDEPQIQANEGGSG